MPTNQLPTKGTKNWGTILNSWLGQLGPASLGGIYNGDTAGRPAGLTADDEGRVYVDTESQELLNWDGSAWQVLLTGNIEQKFNITSKTTDYTITPTEAETGLNGFSNDGATGANNGIDNIIKLTLPDAVTGSKITVIGSEVEQVVEINPQATDTIITTDVPDGKNWARVFMADTLEFYAISDTEWVANEKLSATGYFGGGNDGSSLDTIDGLVFVSETAINPSVTISVARYKFSGANSSTRGYFVGGWDGSSRLDIIDGIKFSDETAINPSTTLSVARQSTASVNSVANGYFTGGHDGSSRLDIIDGIKFSDETAINPSTTLSTVRDSLAGVSSTVNGYLGGGSNSGSTYENIIDGLVFSTETVTSSSATLSIGRSYLTGVNSTTNGYFAGGLDGSYQDTIDGIIFASEAAINSSATLLVARGYLTGVSSAINGYFGGGIDLSSYKDMIDGVVFATETAINSSATLSTVKDYAVGCQSGGIL